MTWSFLRLIRFLRTPEVGSCALFPPGPDPVTVPARPGATQGETPLGPLVGRVRIPAVGAGRAEPGGADQEPAGGSAVGPGQIIDFGAVKDEEDCP